MSDRMSRGAMSRDSSRKLIFGTGKSGQRRASMPNGGSLRTVKQGEAMNETASDDVMAMADATPMSEAEGEGWESPGRILGALTPTAIF